MDCSLLVSRSMNVAPTSERQRRQRVSQPLPARHRPGPAPRPGPGPGTGPGTGPRAVPGAGPRMSGASHAALTQGPGERRPMYRRTLTDLEAAEIAAGGYPEVCTDCTVLYYTRSVLTVLYCTVLYEVCTDCTVLYCTRSVLYCTVLYCTVRGLYCTVLYCTVLYEVCTVLYCTVRGLY